MPESTAAQGTRYGRFKASGAKCQQMDDTSDEQNNKSKETFMSTNITKELAGKVALVTGGSRGIGAAIVKRLAANGADVALSYVASADKATALVRGLEAQGVKTAAFKADQADAGQVAQ